MITKMAKGEFFCAIDILSLVVIITLSLVEISASSPASSFSSSSASSQTRTQNRRNLHDDIDQLASALPGCYSNARQYYTYSTTKTSPHHKRSNLFLLRVEFYRLYSSAFNDSLTIYFQDFTKSSKVPFSSGFYSFSPDYASNTIRMKVYTFKEAVPGLRVSFSNYSIPEGSRTARQLTAAFDRSQLKTHSSCDMVWKKTSVRTFTGVTRSDCLANLGEDSVRISVSMTLTGSRITMTEGWYNMGETARLRELKIPYILKRKPHQLAEQAQHPNDYASPQSQPLVEQNPTFSYSKSRKNVKSLYHSIPSLKLKVDANNIDNSRIRRNLRTYHEKNSLKKKLYNRLNAQTQTQTESENNAKTKSQKGHRRRNKTRVLRKYRHVKASLIAGQRVFYKIDLSKCKMAAQVPVDAVTFGGEITNFQIIREKRNRKRRTKIYFSSSRPSMSGRGAETVQREMTLLRGGHVHVKVVKQIRDRRKRQYTFQCRLFNKKKGRGSVKMFTDLSSPPKEARSMTKLTRSLGQGHNLWLVADVTKCRGKLTETTVMAGGLISDYNMVNDGKTLQLFLGVDQINPTAPQKSRASGFVVNVMKNNDVILTWVNASNEKARVKRKFGLRPAYHCELSNQMSSVSNDIGTESVKVYTR